MNYLKNKLHNLKFKNKLVVSYVLIGVLPFIFIIGYLYIHTADNIEKTIEEGFTNTFKANLNSIVDKADRIENTVEMISMDETMINVTTEHIDSPYDMYRQICGELDIVMKSLLLMNPELTDYRLYVTNNLAGVRKQFLPISELYGTDVYDVITNNYESQWFVLNNQLCLLQKICNLNTPSEFAVLVLEVSEEKFFSEIEDSRYNVTVRGSRLHDAQVENGKKTEIKEAAIFNGDGQFTMYFERQGKLKFAGETLLVSTILLTVSVAAVVFIISLFSKSIASRIERINKSLSTVVSENYANTIPIDYHDEIGDIIVYINDMIEQTRHNIYDVYQSQIKQREYEIKALQAQISPHFLYNTLSAINWYAMEGGDERISDIVISLSKFYRTALNKGESVTTIRNELENIRAYIKIQLRIHNGSFDVEYEVDEQILDYQIPNLILQPVVENALEHGIDQLEDESGKLAIHIREQENTILFEIIDNGPGMSQEVMDKLFKIKSENYGLRNINKRLKLFFGDRYKMDVSCQENTCFTIQIPKQCKNM